MNGPNIKFLIRIGIRVKGIQNTASRRSLMARFNRNTFVTVRILVFWTKVRITSIFPTTAKTNITLYTATRTLNETSESVFEVDILVMEMKSVEFSIVNGFEVSSFKHFILCNVGFFLLFFKELVCHSTIYNYKRKSSFYNPINNHE